MNIFKRQPRLPTLAVITCVYHEELLLPYFLAHYNQIADRIIILLDTADPGMQYPPLLTNKVTVYPLSFVNGFSDRVKIEQMNYWANRVQEDWVLFADTDELVWPEHDPICSTFKQVLQYVSPEDNVVQVGLRSVFRNRYDLDLTLPGPFPVLQRRHGILDPLPGYTKPSLIRPGCGVTLNVGHHTVEGPARISKIHMAGSHWDFADPQIALSRILENRIPRLGQENKKMGWGIHYNGQTREKILEKCNQHLNDPIVVF